MSIDLADVSFTIPDGPALLRDVTFSVAPGEWVALMGASGCGKSSLLKIIAGYLQQTSGSIRRRSETTFDERALASLSYVPQDPSLVLAPWKRVGEHLTWAGSLRNGDSPPPIPNQRLLETAELATERQARQFPATLSGGERKRLALIVCLSHSAELLVLDEPLSGVDLDLRVRLWDLLWDYRRNSHRAVTCIFSTHDIPEASVLGDRVIFLQHHGMGVPTTFFGTSDPREKYIAPARPSSLYINRNGGGLVTYEAHLLQSFGQSVNWDDV